MNKGNPFNIVSKLQSSHGSTILITRVNHGHIQTLKIIKLQQKEKTVGNSKPLGVRYLAVEQGRTEKAPKFAKILERVS